MLDLGTNVLAYAKLTTQVTALVYGRHSNIEVAAFGKGAALRYPFGFWDREKGVWLPLQPVQAEFDIRAYRRNRPKQDDEGYSPFSRNNPIDAAKAAAQSGSFDGAQFGLEFNRLASTRFRTAVERIGTLFQRLYPETMEKVIVASTIKNANPSLDEIRREMSATEHFMPLSKNAEGNRRHIAACVEHNDAKEFLLVSGDVLGHQSGLLSPHTSADASSSVHRPFCSMRKRCLSSRKMQTPRLSRLPQGKVSRWVSPFSDYTLASGHLLRG